MKKRESEKMKMRLKIEFLVVIIVVLIGGAFANSVKAPEVEWSKTEGELK